MTRSVYDDSSFNRRIDALERELSQLRREQRAASQPRFTPPRDVMLGRTCAVNGEYPATGDTFGVIFQDCSFAGSPGTQTVSELARSDSAQVFGRTFDGSYLPENTFVRAERIRGLGDPDAGQDGEWWLSTQPRSESQQWKRYTISPNVSGPIMSGGIASTVVDRSPSNGPAFGGPATGWDHPDFYEDEPDNGRLFCRNAGWYLAHVQVSIQPYWNVTRPLHWHFQLWNRTTATTSAYPFTVRIPQGAKGNADGGEIYGDAVTYDLRMTATDMPRQIGFLYSCYAGWPPAGNAWEGSEQEPGFSLVFKLLLSTKIHEPPNF